MDRDAILEAVEAERLGLADLLDGLDQGEWERKSLCDGWTVHDVVAHLTLATRLSPLAAIGGMLRARGDINRMIGDAARSRSAQYGPAELVVQLRETAGSAKRPLGTQPPDPLVDALVHGQDIARPLGRERAMAAERVLPAIEHVWSSSFYGARTRFDGLRFVATDADWAGGEGTRLVSAPIGELLLLSTGRPAGLERVTGDGAGEAARRVQA
jgi:uncharacterized protein (TIGR03083 family)